MKTVVNHPKGIHNIGSRYSSLYDRQVHSIKNLCGWYNEDDLKEHFEQDEKE